MTDTTLPVPLSAQKIEDIAFAVLRAFDDDKLWRALTYEHGPYDINTPTLALEHLAQAFYAEGARACMAPLQENNAKLKTVMIAAAEEIAAHWAGHCDAEGYGPVNLLHRLEEGIPSEYGYTAGAFKALQERADALQAEVDSLRRAEKWGVKDLRERIWLDPECAEDGCQSLRFKTRADALQTELNSIADTLPGVHYMDPPDGGAPTLVEQFKRMAKDARRADALEEALSHFAAIDLKRADVPADFAWHVLNARSLINPTGGES